MEPLIFSLPKHPFDYQYLTHRLRRYRSPRVKIGLMLKKGEIVRVKKGLYFLPEPYGATLNKILLSNLIYGPSYVSYEYALSYWGVIPEKVEEVTAVTNKRKKRFQTPIGVFSYKYLNNRIFSVGKVLINDGDVSSIIASKEKSLCDKIATVKEIDTAEDAVTYLETDLRIDWDEIRDLDVSELKSIMMHYRSKSVSLFVDWYLTHFT
jgi:predicted transcriptional regulator of viral defense system